MHPRSLARQFAATLAELRETWDVEYWPAGSMPARTAVAPGRSPSEGESPSVSMESEAEPRAAAATPSPVHLPVAGEMRTQAKQWTPATKLDYLRKRNVGDCQRCGLARSRTNIVFGVGNPEAKIMFVGEAPGADEDRQGEPFVGRAGARLNVWLAELGLSRDEVEALRGTAQ